MKPRIFIGSSVEGLNVAYSIQQNLSFDAEITVWDQGVFELSKTTLESLIDKLNSSDFGIFVFSEDDITTIREENKNTVRDNVLFEFGLFIGKLSRERVYFVIPSESELHLPTDLLGITPGKYESNREDGSMQAATGPVANQIRQQIKKLGKRIENEESAKSPDEKKDIDSIEFEWVNDFFDKKYNVARKKLKGIIKKEKDIDKIIEKEIWIAYCDFRENEILGEKALNDLLSKYGKKKHAVKIIAEIFSWEDYFDKAIEILKQGLIDFDNDTELVSVLTDCIKKTEGVDKAMELLNEHNPNDNIEVALKLSSLYEDEGSISEARKVIHKIYMRYPNNENIKYKYARIAIDLEENEIALYLFKSLTVEHPNKYDYWGYLSNSAIPLDFYDLAFKALRKAEELSKSKESWIKSNIGNILNNKGLYTEAVKYLEKGIELNKSSEYAHNRLSSTIKNQEEEIKKVEIKRKEGLQKIRNFEIE
ncbi:MAG TPA: DNA-binding protein [Candidatus Moranbacteria bacterium]|nr:DNA-binding protein [Candidatus Moranbacteria bacterium]